MTGINKLIIDQVFEFLIMLYAGMTIMIFYEIFDWIKYKTKPRKVVLFIEDILFWIFAALIISSFLYYCSYGKISIHAFIAFGVGVFLWKKCFYGIIKH
ncbi:spore cortex biosynthesis protein YabQ [Anaerovorax odorimutans]|uniref:spore cortex biosynthesis protein YabQ n=1 Tax=Anaerovorax odorimutans TaxID=109327 RepID=UPI00047F5B23|nr:spore cortex biosynthesis protein YabQ [Anaerovorax odorimutans]